MVVTVRLFLQQGISMLIRGSYVDSCSLIRSFAGGECLLTAVFVTFMSVCVLAILVPFMAPIIVFWLNCNIPDFPVGPCPVSDVLYCHVCEGARGQEIGLLRKQL